MPFVSGKVLSKTLGRTGGWRFLIQSDWQSDDEGDLPIFKDLAQFDYLHIHSWDCGRARLVGLEDGYEKHRWMFDDEAVGAGFTQLYCRPNKVATDIYIYLSPKTESAWERELNTGLKVKDLEIELRLHPLLGNHDSQIDRHDGSLLTFRNLPELSLARTLEPEGDRE